MIVSVSTHKTLLIRNEATTATIITYFLLLFYLFFYLSLFISPKPTRFTNLKHHTIKYKINYIKKVSIISWTKKVFVCLPYLCQRKNSDFQSAMSQSMSFQKKVIQIQGTSNIVYMCGNGR